MTIEEELRDLFQTGYANPAVNTLAMVESARERAKRIQFRRNIIITGLAVLTAVATIGPVAWNQFSRTANPQDVASAAQNNFDSHHGAASFPFRLDYLPDGLIKPTGIKLDPAKSTADPSSALELNGRDGTHLDVRVEGPMSEADRQALGPSNVTVSGRSAWYDNNSLVVDFDQCRATIAGSYTKQELIRVAEGLRIASWNDPKTWNDNPLRGGP